MKKKFLWLSVLVASVLKASCSKDNETSTNSDPNSYIPLTIGNMWVYKTPTMSLTQGIEQIVTGTVVRNGKTYFLLVDSRADSTFLRKDAKGNIVKLSGTVETIMVPATPVLNQHWLSGDSIDSLVVVNTDAAVNAYNGLTEVGTYKRNGTKMLSANYFKKGVGVIKSITFDSDTLTLNSYSFK